MTPATHLDPGALLKLLADMPDNWGDEFPVAIHPHSAGLPRCPRRFLFSKRLGWYKPYWVEALYVGNIFHDMLCQRYSGQSLDSAIEGVLQSQALDMERQVAEYRNANPEATAPDTGKSLKALALGAALARVWDENFPLPADWQILAVEQRISRPLTDIDVGPPLEGTLDLVVYDPAKGRTWLVEHKTTSYDIATRAAPAPFDSQVLLYRALWDSVHPDSPLYGVIHGIIQKPTIRQRTKRQPETLDEYAQRCAEWYDTQMLTNPTRPCLGRSYVAFTRPPLTQDSELRSLLHMTGRWLTKAPYLSGFPRDCHHCITTYGSLCPYMPLCQQENPTLWHGILTREGFSKRSPNNYPKAAPTLETGSE